MSQDRDTADVLTNMLPPSFPPEARKDVFHPSGPDAELQAAWDKWGGTGNTVFDRSRAPECGICLFRRQGADDMRHEEFFQQVIPFFVKGGDVFEYQPEENLFRRIDVYTFGLYYAPK